MATADTENLRRALEHNICRSEPPVVVKRPFLERQTEASLLYDRNGSACSKGSKVAELDRQHTPTVRGAWRAMYMLNASESHLFEAQ